MNKYQNEFKNVDIKNYDLHSFLKDRKYFLKKQRFYIVNFEWNDKIKPEDYSFYSKLQKIT